MKVVSKIFAACALLLSVNTSAFVLNTQTTTADNGDKILTNSMNLLYDAIFNITDLIHYVSAPANVNVGVQAQSCINIDSFQTIQILTVQGYKLRVCADITDPELINFFLSNNAKTFSAEFASKMLYCADNTTSSDIMSCYVDTLSDMFEVIATYGGGTYVNNRPCLQSQLQTTVNLMTTSTNQFNNCMAQIASAKAAPAKPASTSSSGVNLINLLF